MGLKTFFKNLKLINSQTADDLFLDFQSMRARFSRSVTRRAVTRYLAKNPVSRLHLGAGDSTLNGWLNTDLAPRSSEIVRMNVTAPFPIADQTFDYVFSEHLIEHLSWRDGAFMLGECYRILKPGGTIRLATPDLSVLLGLYHNESSAGGDNYIRWITDEYMDDMDDNKIYRPAFVINNAFRMWGHRFLYDKELLEIALRQAGFVNIVSCRYKESSDKNLRGIELHGKNAGNEDTVEFETMVFEAKRPFV